MSSGLSLSSSDFAYQPKRSLLPDEIWPLVMGFSGTPHVDALISKTVGEQGSRMLSQEGMGLIYEDYKRNRKIRRFMAQATYNRPLLAANPDLNTRVEIVKATYRAVMDRAKAVGIQADVEKLRNAEKPLAPLALSPVIERIERVEHANLLIFYAHLRMIYLGIRNANLGEDEDPPAEAEAPLQFAGTIAEQAEAARAWIESHQVIWSSIGVLNLAGLGLTAIPTELRFFTGLTRLDLVHNKLGDLWGLPPLANLRELYLERNRLSDLQGLPQLPALRKLTLMNNKIRDLRGFRELPQLQWVNLDNNKLQTLAGFPRLPELTTLYLKHNSLRSARGLPELPALEGLYLGYNQLADVEHLPPLSSLRVLDLGNNSLTNLGGLPHFPNLHTLRAHDNRLTAITRLQGFPELPNLETLDLEHNRLRDLLGLPRLPNLQQLYLQGNLLRNLESFPSLENLNHLDVRNNPLENLKGFLQVSNVVRNFWFNGTRRLTHLPWGWKAALMHTHCSGALQAKIDKYLGGNFGYKSLEYYDIFDYDTMPLTERAQFAALKKFTDAYTHHRKKVIVATLAATSLLGAAVLSLEQKLLRSYFG